MDRESKDLEDRIEALPDEELLRMLFVESDQYREEALRYAREEIEKRGLVFHKSETYKETKEAETRSRHKRRYYPHQSCSSFCTGRYEITVNPAPECCRLNL